MRFFKNKENLLVLGIVALVLFLAYGRDQMKPKPVQGLLTVPEATEAAEPAQIMIHLTGRVKKPGVITLSDDARFLDAVDAAGGFLPDADTESINLSMKLKDEDKIHVPAVGEEPQAAVSAGLLSEPGLIDLNFATGAELETLPGIGPALSQRIMEYREKTPFTSIEDIKNVSGIGDKLFEGMKEQITVR